MEHASKNGSAPQKTATAPLTLDPAGVKLWKLEDGSLLMKLRAEGSERKILLGPPRRSLPLSDPDRWIIFSDLDGAEVGVLRAIDELDESSQAVLREALRAEYRIERIVRILEVEREPLSGQTHWRVQIAPDEPEPAPDSSPASTSSSTSTTSESPSPEGEDEADKSRPLEKVASLLSLGRGTYVGEDFSTAIEREFTIAGQEDVQTARYPHIFIVDTERRRYEIPNCEALDSDSRKAAERFF